MTVELCLRDGKITEAGAGLRMLRAMADAATPVAVEKPSREGELGDRCDTCAINGLTRDPAPVCRAAGHAITRHVTMTP